MQHRGKRTDEAHARRKQRFNQSLVAKSFIDDNTVHDYLLAENVCKCDHSEAYQFVCAIAKEMDYHGSVMPHLVEKVEHGLVLSNSNRQGSRQIKYVVVPPENDYCKGSIGWQYRLRINNLLEVASREANQILSRGRGEFQK